MANKKTTFDLGTVNKAVKWGLLNDLSGVHFCQTGAMSVTRPQMDQLILACGGVVDSVVKGETKFLIIPDHEVRKGSKYKAAESRGTTIITEQEFCEMILPTVEELRAM